MNYPISRWSIKKSDENEILHEQCSQVTVSVVRDEHSLIKSINIDKYSKYLRLIRVTARLFQAFQAPNRSPRNIFEYPSAATTEKAECLWIRAPYKLLGQGLEKGDYERRCPKKNEDGIYVVTGRAEKWF